MYEYFSKSSFDFFNSNNDQVINELCKIKGIGPWSSQMFLIFVLYRIDIFSKGDLALMNSIKINSIYNHNKINSLFKNFDTMSFLDLIVNYKQLLKKGYNETFLNQNLHTMLALPFFLFMMTALAAMLTLNTLKKSDNTKFIIVGLVVSVLIFYFKDLSIALGQTERIPLILAVWAPVIALSLFIFIGVLQINEK